jgi:hypothetical protein
MNKIYSLQINTTSCNFSLYLNGCEIFNYKGSMPIQLTIPVNEWLIGNENKFQLTITPSDGSTELNTDTNASISVITNYRNESKLNAKKLKEYPLPRLSGDRSEKEVKKSEVITGEFISPLEYENTFYNTVEEISTFQKEDIYEAYKKLHSIFKRKDTDAFLKAINFKLSEFSKAYNLKKEDEMRRQGSFFERLVAADLFLLDINRVRAKYILPNRLVLLEDEEGDQPIYFYDRLNKLQLGYPVYWGKLAGNNELSIIR